MVIITGYQVIVPLFENMRKIASVGRNQRIAIFCACSVAIKFSVIYATLYHSFWYSLINKCCMIVLIGNIVQPYLICWNSNKIIMLSYINFFGVGRKSLKWPFDFMDIRDNKHNLTT